ncbi:MAG: asparagine synthetase B, partial [Elusimicrobia bacterium]|nr:asparagine synthetase B [Elusimicrobiota bacterium]
MCGICGVVKHKGGIVPEETVVAMAEALAHRGPDDEGFYFEPQVGLGFKRLSIIDLETGRQPMLSLSGLQALVFNGEIYNYRELRSYLKSKHYPLQTAS